MNLSLRRRVAPAVALSLLSFGAGCITGEQDLAIAEDLLVSLPNYTGYLVARDFNRDKRPDLGVINLVASNFSVRLNKGDGTFHDVVRYPVGVQPTFIATADFDDDRTLDVAVINGGSSDVSILLGDGDGAFHPTLSHSIADPANGQIAAAPFGLVAEDFNHDGVIDIVTSNVGTNNLSSLLGNGDGTFQSATTYPLMGPSSLGFVPFPLVSVDFDHDGNLDVISGGAAHIVMLRGHGDGSFTAVGNYPTGVAMTCIEAADFNGDHVVDLVTTAMGSSNYSILLGDGSGGFTLRETKWSGGIAGQCFGIGDLNKDRELDLAITNSSGLLGTGNVAVLLGNGDGSFGNPVRYSLGVTPWAASVVDFNGDGDKDVAACNGGNGSVSLLFGNGNGTLRHPTHFPM
jgi:hypothetical protein